MYSSSQLAKLRQQDMLTRAAEDRQAMHLRALWRASRRVERARQRLSRAQRDALRARSGVDVSCG